LLAWQLSFLDKEFVMKVKLLAAAGVALFVAVAYYFTRKKKVVQTTLPRKEAERHHLTNVFSRAKEIATGN
jgi:mannose/fructose/N-acetylgalactosamine-specific phosphotransferase system component IIC